MLFRALLLCVLVAPCPVSAHEEGVQRSGFFIDHATVPLVICPKGGNPYGATLQSSYGGRVACVVAASVATVAINVLQKAVNPPPAPQLSFSVAFALGAFVGTAIYAVLAWDQQYPKVFFHNEKNETYGYKVGYAHKGMSGPLLRVLRGALPAVPLHGELVPGRLVSLRLHGEFAKYRFVPEKYFRIEEAIVVLSDGEKEYEIPVQELQFLESCGARMLRWYRGFW